MLLEKITLKNFKGVKSAEYKLKAQTEIKGKNGSGKTTILDAITWALIDTDYVGHSNPNIAPIGNEESTTVVALDFDGHTFTKTQERLLKDDVLSVTNTFAMDGVPKKKNDITDAFSEIGINLELFKPLALPYSFVGTKSEEQRAVLLGMVDEISDEAIARSLEYEALATMLEAKTADDIKAKVTAEKKAVEKVHGKDGALTKIRIDTLEEILDTFLNSENVHVEQDTVDYVEDLIDGWKAKQRAFNQQIADAERILNQLSEVEAEKIRRYEKEINSKFDGVSFKLWETQKNGEKKPCCKPIVDGFVMGGSTNTAREFLAKINIMLGLQKNYKEHFPILIDGAEALDKDSKRKIDQNITQIVLATVNEGALKLN